MKSELQMDSLVVALGKIIQSRRRQLGYSQDQLANRAGLHRTYISEIERRSRNLSVKILVQIAVALSIDASELMKLAEAAATNQTAVNAESNQISDTD